MIILSPRTLQLPRLVSVLLKSAQKLHKVLLFLRRQFCAANHVEEFHGVFQGQESPVVHVRRRSLDPAERERFDGSIRAGHHAVNHLRFIQALRLKVVHQVIGEIRSRMAAYAVSFAEKNLLSVELRNGGFFGIKLSVDVQFGRRRKIQNLLKLSHKMNLAAALQDVDTLLCGDYLVTVEIRGALLELSKIFNGLESTLGPEKTLDVHASERRSLDAMAELLWANVTDFMGGAIFAAIRVAVEAGYAEAWFFGSTIFGCVELLLRKTREQEA